MIIKEGMIQMINNRNLILHDSSSNSYRVDVNRNFQADGKDPVLVKRDPESSSDWQVVDKLEGPINREDMNQYGLWQDKEVTETKGMLWWKKTEVLRPEDGKIQSDEVKPLFIHHYGPKNFREIGERGVFVGAEIATTQTPQGSIFFLNSISFSYSDRLINAGQQAGKEALEIRSDNSNWLVK